MSELEGAAGDVPTLAVSRLLMICTGSAATANSPFWIDWLRSCYPQIELTVVITRSAQRFVTQQALASRVSNEVLVDIWPEDESRARHVELAQWAEAMVVYPMTLHFMARLALGMSDSPALLAAQCSTAPIALAPALPPGGLESAACRMHWTALTARPNVVLVPPVPGMSLTTGRRDAWVPPPLSTVIELIERRRVELAAAAPDQPGCAAAFLADRTTP